MSVIRAPLPGTRLIVKDPFALLSMETIADVTGALLVLIYRLPGAVLTSCRRMGWHPDIEEVRHAAGREGAAHGRLRRRRPSNGMVLEDLS